MLTVECTLYAVCKVCVFGWSTLTRVRSFVFVSHCIFISSLDQLTKFALQSLSDLVAKEIYLKRYSIDSCAASCVSRNRCTICWDDGTDRARRHLQKLYCKTFLGQKKLLACMTSFAHGECNGMLGIVPLHTSSACALGNLRKLI